jgi:CHAD domain-containing protein
MSIDPNRVQKPVRKLRKLLKQMPSQPTQDQVHDLRTNARRLQAMVDSSSVRVNGKTRRILKDVSRMRKRAGQVRDMDVLTAMAASLQPQAGEKACLVQLLEKLGAERREHAKSLHTIVAKRRKRVRNRLKKISHHLERAFEATDNSPKRGSVEMAASALKLETGLGAPARLVRSNLHAYRLKVKELHDLLRTSHDGEQQFVKVLATVKDSIGEWHDWEELAGLVKETVDHGPKCGLLSQIKQVAEKKFEIAMDKTQSMRKRYIQTSAPKRRMTVQPSEPVWHATRAIAA